MAHQGNSVNLLVQHGNGQQQLIKVLQTNPSAKALTAAGLKTIVKEVIETQDSSRIMEQSIVGTSQTIRTAGGHTQKMTINTGVPNKTIKLTPSQVNAIKMSQATSSNPPRVISLTTAMVSSSSSSSTHHTPSTKKTPTTSGGVQSRRRKTDKVGKGLRHFSMKVCEKVKEKGITTYNEVADELVQEEIEGQPIDPMNYDQKNIRRRVYDALNVLMAMNIISKEKKEIRWIGLPTNSVQQCTSLELENQKRKERIEEKQQQLRELLLQQISFKSLVTRNKEAEERGIIPTPNSAIQLPFIIVNTHKKTHINCSISNDKSEYFFKFDDTFKIHDDVDVLKRMGLLFGLDKGECSAEDLERAKSMVPQAFRKYIEMYGRGQDDIDISEEWEVPYDYIVNESSLITPKTEYCEDDDDEMLPSDSDGD